MNIVEEETAFEWFQRSKSISSPVANATNAFLSRRGRGRGYNWNEPSSIPEGTGISFMDQIFKSSDKKNGNIVFEISGGSGSGKTTLATSLAASYISATSLLDESETNTSITSVTQLPKIVILDAEYGIHIPILASSVRAAIIRRYQKRSDGQSVLSAMDRSTRKEEMEIEDEIASALARIHICHPRNCGIGFVSTLEVIRHALDAQSNISNPIMIIIDSLGAFEQRERMMEESRSGLSGRGDFIRQLGRLLRANKNVMVFATLTGNYQEDSWNKLVTHKVSLERVKSGTLEEREGFEFVALLNDCNVVVPFSVTSGGILC